MSDNSANTAEPIYAIPGTMCDERLWHPLNQRLNQRLNIKHIATEKADTIEKMTDVVATELPHKATLLGFSLGGYIALNFAIQHPERIGKLIIVATSALGLPESEKLKRQKMLNVLSKPGTQYLGMSDNQLRAFIGEPAWQNQNLVKTIRDMDNSLGIDVFLHQMRETTNRPSLLDQLHKICCPVLLVGAEQDSIVSLSHLEQMAERFEQASLVTIKNCGHMVPLEKAEALADVIAEFI